LRGLGKKKEKGKWPGQFKARASGGGEMKKEEKRASVGGRGLQVFYLKRPEELKEGDFY